MAHLSRVVLCSIKSITAHQRQINNSITSKRCCSLRNNNVGNIYRLKIHRLQRLTVMPDLILSCSCCTNWDMFDVAAVEEER